MKIELNVHKRMFLPKFYPLLNDYSHRYEIYMGSAGSGKSHFITQKIILKALKHKRRVLIARRYGSTLRNSVFAAFKDVLNTFQLTPYCKIRETDMYIKLPNDSELIFIGLDDEQKLLSIVNISDIFVEEIFEIGKDIYEQLNLRMRGNAPNQQIFAAFNPISKHHWLYNYCVENPPSKLLFLHSTYKDNTFLPKAYSDSLDEMARLNPQKYRVYGLGEWGIDSEGLVYQNWTIEEFDALELAAKGFQHRVGMDMGFIDASTIVSTLYDADNRTIYVYEDFYKTGCQLEELVTALTQRKLQKTRIYCDSADARAIAYFRQHRFSVEASKKGKGSVDIGIAFLQNHKIIVHPSCKDVIRELENYSYKKSKQTGEYTNDTTHEFSHSLDALRYAFSDIYTQNKVTTLNKAVLGL